MHLRVCHVTTAHSLEDDRIFHKEAVSLASKGFRVSIMGPSAKRIYEKAGVTLIGIPQVRSRCRLLRRILLLFRIRFRSMVMRSHIYHCHEMDAVVAVLPNRIFGSKVVYDVHEHFPDNYEGSVPNLCLLILRILDRFVSRMVHLVVTVDETLAWKYRASRSVTVIHNYPLYRSYSDLQGERDRDLAIYVGGLSKERGVLEMIEGLSLARRRHPNLRLKMVGRFVRHDLGQEIETRIRELGLGGAVEIVDWVPFEEIPAMLAQGGLGISFLRPLRRYRAAIPIKVYEYMAAGIPVVASAFEKVAELLEFAACGVTAESGSGEALSNAISTLLSDPEKARQMGERGRRLIRDKLNWERESEVLYEAYEKII